MAGTTATCDTPIFGIAAALFCDSSFGLIQDGKREVPLMQYLLNPPQKMDLLAELPEVLRTICTDKEKFAPYKVVGNVLYISSTAPKATMQMTAMLDMFLTYMKSTGWQVPTYKLLIYCNCNNIRAVIAAPPPVPGKRLVVGIDIVSGFEQLAVFVLEGPAVIKDALAEAGFREDGGGGLLFLTSTHVNNDDAMQEFVKTLVFGHARRHPMEVILSPRAASLHKLAFAFVQTKRVLVGHGAGFGIVAAPLSQLGA